MIAECTIGNIAQPLDQMPTPRTLPSGFILLPVSGTDTIISFAWQIDVATWMPPRHMLTQSQLATKITNRFALSVRSLRQVAYQPGRTHCHATQQAPHCAPWKR